MCIVDRKIEPWYSSLAVIKTHRSPVVSHSPTSARPIPGARPRCTRRERRARRGRARFRCSLGGVIQDKERLGRSALTTQNRILAPRERERAVKNVVNDRSGIYRDSLRMACEATGVRSVRIWQLVQDEAAKAVVGNPPSLTGTCVEIAMISLNVERSAVEYLTLGD